MLYIQKWQNYNDLPFISTYYEAIQEITNFLIIIFIALDYSLHIFKVFESSIH